MVVSSASSNVSFEPRTFGGRGLELVVWRPLKPDSLLVLSIVSGRGGMDFSLARWVLAACVRLGPWHRLIAKASR